MRSRLLVFISALLFFCSPTLHAQSGYVVIDSISITGHKKTKTNIISRELTFKIGDTIQLDDLNGLIEFNRERIKSIGLFNVVDANIIRWDDASHIIVQFKVTESLFIWPIPIFELADRNFNVWFNEMNQDPRRVNYGLTLLHKNTTGHRDPLRLTFQFGFTPKFDIEYSKPYIDKKQRIGLKVGAYYIRSFDIGFGTSDNLLLFHHNGSEVQTRIFRVHMLATWRPKLYTRQELGLRYFDVIVSDTVARHLNPDYLLNGRKELQYLSLSYSYRIDRRDLAIYASEGYVLETVIKKDGFGLPFEGRNTLRIDQTNAYWVKLHPKIISDSRLFFMLQLQRKKPDFFNYRALGYGARTLKGYEHYVINGIDFAMAQQSFRFQLIKGEPDTRFLGLSRIPKIPYQINLASNFDIGYVNDPFYSQNNSMTNRWLYSTSIGFDFLWLGRNLAQVHYAINHTGEGRFYLQFQATL